MESVKDKLSERAYKLLELPKIKFKYGSLVFATPDTIDKMQNGYRYNGLTGEKLEEWKEEFVIIGHDTSAGLGPDPFIVDISDSKLPVYWLMTDGGDYDNPDLICEDLETFSKIIMMLSEEDDYEYNILTEEDIENILNKIKKIENKETISPYWSELLYSASEEE